MKHKSSFAQVREPGHLVSVEPLESRSYLSVDLTDAVSLVAPKSGVKAGSKLTMSVEVLNNGTTAADGPLQVNLSISPNAHGSASIALAPVTKTIRLKALAHTTLRLSDIVPLGTTAGAYYGVAVVDPNDAFSETSITGNTALSTNTVIVQNAFPDVLGTWSGSNHITKGFGKGDTYRIVQTITSENQTTGNFTFTEKILFGGTTLSGEGQGNVTTKGAFTETATHVPVDASGTIHIKGKLSKDKIAYKYFDAIASGTGNLTLEI